MCFMSLQCCKFTRGKKKKLVYFLLTVKSIYSSRLGEEVNTVETFPISTLKTISIFMIYNNHFAETLFLITLFSKFRPLITSIEKELDTLIPLKTFRNSFITLRLYEQFTVECVITFHTLHNGFEEEKEEAFSFLHCSLL